MPGGGREGGRKGGREGGRGEGEEEGEAKKELKEKNDIPKSVETCSLIASCTLLDAEY